ncbi:hypothetical protein ABPG74_013872 [Tetrahymena malaccensis]
MIVKGQQRNDPIESAALLDNKADLKAKQEAAKQAIDDDIKYFQTNKLEKLMVLIGSSAWSFWLIKFGLKTVEQNLQTPILGVEMGPFGYYQDKSDAQWGSFIDNFHILLSATIVFLILSKCVKAYCTTQNSKTALMVFNITMGASMFIYMFRGGFLFWIFFTFINFILGKLFSGKKLFPALLWGFNIALIFLNDKYHGFNLVDFFHTDLLQGLEDSRKDQVVSWHIMYNMTMLRVISFCMDMHWAKLQFRSLKKDKHFAECTQCQNKIICLKERQEQFHEIEEYNLLTLYSYMLYLPVLIQGPPITFNAFYSQIKSPQQTHTFKDKLKYTLRTVFIYVVFEIWIHINFGFALATRSENENIWRKMDSMELFMCGFNTLMFIWQKFNCLWKYSRCWALWDDIEVPENMNRCVNNNYCFEGFWRSWHRGFNQWLIRYIYLPCGGSKTKHWNIWIVFTYVAIWHDLNINLILWAWGICLCLIPEIGVKQLFKKPRFYKYTRTFYWKYICALCGGTYIIFLIFTNLIGFGTGYQTLILFLQKSFSSITGVFQFLVGLCITSCVTLYMMEMRVMEKKNF